MDFISMRQKLFDMAAQHKPIEGCIAMRVGALGTIYWDGTGAVPVFHEEECEVAAVITTDALSFERLVTRVSKVKPLFLLGKLKVQGNMQLAMRAAEMF
ncbi:SCP2 sterol-binding domain-containing protein [Pseudomonas benzenivorans]|uniref:SCP2 sterol-binding domain-containing protein n=1 Tax=Pseudomonas benzenivorans TaxID=556533 RepID=A0ABY5HBU0_9PSED|nr:SCP2 sterol-binding domain-containing protein [Pseudomonas benzenivorans]UTW09668.1 SCP2 sterol-binding domain-containing protein [Pseudomonas benzenivorans]